MKVYISGKISGLDFDEVKAKFAEAEDFLNEIGIEAVNPLKNGLSVDNAWIKHLCKDIEILNDCDCIYLMEGWQESVGACIEYDFAMRTGKKILFASSIIRHDDSVKRVKRAVHEVTGIDLEQYKQKSRKQNMHFARMLFAYYCRGEKVGLIDIGRLLKRDPSTIQYLCQKFHDELQYNKEFRQMTHEMNRILASPR